MRWAERRCTDDGMITVELVAVLPVLVLITGVLLSAILLVGEQIRVQDAASEAARWYSRGDMTHAHAALAALGTGAAVQVTRSGADLRVTVNRQAHLFARWLPAMHVSGTAVTAAEPTGQSP